MNATQTSSLDFLIIDDNPDHREILIEFVKHQATGLGMQVGVSEAADGKEGLEKYGTRLSSGKPYDVVLTDLNMPNTTGDVVTKTIKGRNPQTLVYVITGGEATDEYRKLSEKLGTLKPDGVIQKPLHLDIFHELFIEIVAKKASIGYANPQQIPEAHQS